VLLEALEACAWNFTRASERLGLPRNTLRYRIERLGLAPEAPRERPRGGRPPGPARRSAAEYAAASPTSPTAESPKPVEHEEPTSRAERVTFLEVRLAAPPRHTWEASRALEASAAKATAFGGHIDELGTDRLRVAFGLEPDEEAPRRAAYAALAVRRLALGADGRDVELPVAKLALHTEAVGVSHGSGGVRLDDHARARACLVLQELLDAAPPGSVVASASTGRFVARRFELVPVAAVDGPCRVIRPAEVGRTPFVGRERELRLLGECFEMARAGHGQVVMIAGEAGVGKSRLLGELRRRLGRSATWIEGQALSFGRSAPLHPIVAMLRRVFRIEDGDPEAVVVDKIEAGVQRVGPDLDETLPFLRHLLSVDPGAPALLAMDPRQRQDAIVRATSLLLARGAELRPHVIALEDLHWCDPATEDWLTRLAGGCWSC
jgi:hypothetical protein